MNYELLKEMIDCVKREVSLRFAVYPKLIANGKMTQEKAEKEKKLMYLVQLSLQKIYEGNAPEEVQMSLFGSDFSVQAAKKNDNFLKYY